MGIRFKTNTWRAPLRLIDSLLPLGSATHALVPRKPSRALQLFARAGWLRPATNPPARPAPPEHTTATQRQACSVRILKSSNMASGGNRDMRMVISGRIGDVCAELDRMAALEQSALLRQM